MSHLRAECQCDWYLVVTLHQQGICCTQQIRYSKQENFHGTFICIDSCVLLTSRNLFLPSREDFKTQSSTVTRPTGCNKSLIHFFFTDRMMTPQKLDKLYDMLRDCFNKLISSWVLEPLFVCLTSSCAVSLLLLVLSNWCLRLLLSSGIEFAEMMTAATAEKVLPFQSLSLIFKKSLLF